MKKTNAFGHEIPSLGECVDSRQLRDLLVRQLEDILPTHGEPSRRLIGEFFEAIHSARSDEDIATDAQRVLRQGGTLLRLRSGLAARSERIVTQIRPHVSGRSVMDYGCGDGEVGRRLSDLGHEVSTADVMDYRTEAARRLPWRLLDAGSPRPVQERVDCLLLLTVLHHCEDPLGTLSHVRSFGAQRVVAIESVYGVEEAEALGAFHADACTTANALAWLRLPREEQFRYACFWDWFYNKVVNSGVFVPYNFSSPHDWRDRMKTIGYEEATTVYLGIDQPLVPEFHVLQVFAQTTDTRDTR